MTRCAWCNGSDGELRRVTLVEGRERRDVSVHAKHEASLVRWHARVARSGPRVVTILVFAPLLLLASVGVAALAGRGAVLAIVGLAVIGIASVVWKHPYATPQTMRIVGVRTSITLVRVGAALLAVGGIAALIAGLSA
jgi:hypothetical protein